MKIKFLTILCIFVCNYSSFSQSLEEILKNEQTDTIETSFTYATFKTSRIINSQTIESPGKGDLQFCISHRFGLLNSGFQDFFGLDESANIRTGFAYGISERLSVGIGRSKGEKLYDMSLKYAVIRQQTGIKNIPFSLSIYSGAVLTTMKYKTSPFPYKDSYRFSYYNQILIASKLSHRLSLQLMPIWIHKNLVEYTNDKNDIFVPGIGARFKLKSRFALCGEYYKVFDNQFSTPHNDSFSLGLDIETGGHVFQVHLSNTLGMNEKSFVPDAEYSWSNGDILLGFNIIRTF